MNAPNSKEVMKTQDDQQHNTMRLYSRTNRRLYLNASERARFLQACGNQSAERRVFALTLFYTGCRLSEARELTFDAIQFEEHIISIRSLKKRSQHHIREVPVPALLTDELQRLKSGTSDNDRFWKIDRITAYRWIKAIMQDASIVGNQASPKGLRHAYGINAISCGIQLHMLQKWMGHASIKTTAIYANAIGEEEKAIAQKMW